MCCKKEKVVKICVFVEEAFTEIRLPGPKSTEAHGKRRRKPEFDRNRCYSAFHNNNNTSENYQGNKKRI